MKRKILRYALLLLVPALAVLTGSIIFSPYGNQEGFSYKLIKSTVEINAPADSVFRFLGNSENAAKWSVFVDHISPLNPDSFADDQPGLRRRCFCREDETGTQWDELITAVIPNKKRQLSIYNMKDFSMTAQHLATEQLYEVIEGNKCRLSLTLFYMNNSPTLWESLKTYIAAYKVKKIFDGNLENIKRIAETGK